MPDVDVGKVIRRLANAADALWLREQGQDVLPDVATDVLCKSMLLDAAALVDHYSAVVVR